MDWQNERYLDAVFGDAFPSTCATASTANPSTVTLDTVKDSLRKLEEAFTKGIESEGTMGNLLGMKVVVPRPLTVPKIELSADVPVSAEFRHDFNAWLLDFFGTEELCVVKPGTAMVINRNTILVHCVDYAKVAQGRDSGISMDFSMPLL